jgi:uncharacterized protein YjbI with pentapeptide repeats
MIKTYLLYLKYMSIIINNISYDNAIFYGNNYRNIEYINCNFNDVNFNNCTFNNVIFNQCILTNINFNSCVFIDMYITNYSKVINVYYGKNVNINNILDLSSALTSNILFKHISQSIQELL